MHLQLLLAGTQWAQLFFALSALILLHEFGHFFFAKLFKTKVEKFYLFFDFLFPLSGVLNFSLFKWKKGDTQYGIGWFPLGGYVKIAGMVDESMDKDAMAQPPQPWEYRSKPAWQRLLIMLGGIIVNVLTAIVVYMFVFGVWGEKYLPVQNAKWGLAADSLGQSLGFRNGDNIVSINGKPVSRLDHLMGDFILQEARTVEVTRDGGVVQVRFPEGTIHEMLKTMKRDGAMLVPRVPIVVHDVVKNMEGARILKPGDSIVMLNGQQVFFYDDFRERLSKLKKQSATITVVRDGKYVSQTATIDSNGSLGFHVYGGARYFNFVHVPYTPMQAIGKGFSYTWYKFGEYFSNFKMLFTSKEVKLNESLGGIGTFAQIFPETFSWEDFLGLVAFVSIVLAFMNLLPIPGLDGGYVIFLLYELITRRKVSEKVMERATMVGLILLLGLMLYANGLDIFRAWFKK